MSDTEDMRGDKMLEAFFVTTRQKRLPFEDARRALRYPLLRLSLVGLSQQDMKELTELGQAVIQEGDVREAARRIEERRGASPLACTTRRSTMRGRLCSVRSSALTRG